jgi:YD repeat-containing protein
LYYSINGTTTTAPGIPDATKKVGSWYLVTVKIPKSATDATVQVWCGTTGACNFDDFRVHPYDASMVSYVYNQWGEVSHILNANNFYTEYLYDESGRLIRVNQETIQYGVVKASESTLHYGFND